MTAIFDTAFAAVVGVEGGFQNDPADKGNWTGGTVGAGELRGTKFGISAAAFATLDIANLTLAGAKLIYFASYWQPIQGGVLPPALALLVFDAAVNNGVAEASRLLQLAVGASPDGVIGPHTLGALAAEVARDGVPLVCGEFQARRTVFMAAIPEWRGGDALGYARRLCGMLVRATGLFPPAQSAA